MSLTLHEACLEVQEVLGKSDPMRGVGMLVQRWEREQVVSKRTAYDALVSFLSTDDEALYDAVYEQLDGFVGWCAPQSRVWGGEPNIHDTSRVLRVCAGVWRQLSTGPTRYFVARRSGPRAYAGCWEFPGGKEDDGESSEACLRREWQEELGVAVAVGPRVYTGRFTTTDLTDFEMVAFSVQTSGVPEHHVHDEIRWMTRAEVLALPDDQVTPSLKPIVGALSQ